MKRLIEPLLFGLLIVIVLSSVGYGVVMLGVRSSLLESIVDAVYFSVQTVTTVGYGNWWPPQLKESDRRVLWVKVISIPTMIGGAYFFTTLVAVMVASRMLSQPGPAGPLPHPRE